MSYATFGDYLAATGHTRTIYITSTTRQRRTAPFNAAMPYRPFVGNADVTRLSFRARYGYYDEGLRGDGSDPSQRGIDPLLFSAGDTVGERGVNVSTLLAIVARHPSNPLELVDNPNYRVTEQDRQDCLKVQDLKSPQNAVFSGLLVEELAKIEGPPQPPVPIPPPHPTPQPPIAPPAPAPGPALPPLTPAAARVEELRELALVTLSLTRLPLMGYELSALFNLLASTTWVQFKPTAVAALKAARIARKMRGDPRPIPPEDL